MSEMRFLRPHSARLTAVLAFPAMGILLRARTEFRRLRTKESSVSSRHRVFSGAMIVAAFWLGTSAGPVQARTYVTLDGSVSDIMSRYGGVHGYSGPNLTSNAEFRGAQLYAAILFAADLSRSNLSNSNLEAADVGYSLLSDTNFSHANVAYAWFGYSLLWGANFNGASMTGTILEGAQLDGATFDGADLYLSNFLGADVDGADFSGAIFERTLNLGTATGSAYYDDRTEFHNVENFDPVTAGWRLVPEPNGMLLGIASLSCIGLLARRRRYSRCWG